MIIFRRVVAAKKSYKLKNAQEYFVEHLCGGDYGEAVACGRAVLPSAVSESE